MSHYENAVRLSGNTSGLFTPPYNPTYIKPATDDPYTGASDLQARILRAQRNDYLARFAPLEDKLAGMVSSGGRGFGLVNYAGKLTRQQFDVMDQIYQRNLAGFGIRQTDRSRQARRIKTDTARSLAQVDAMNRTRRQVKNDNLQALAGGLSNAGN